MRIPGAVLLALTAMATLGQPNSGDKGSIFLYWGYNRACYSWSDIHFDGPGYDFTLRHVRSADRPSAFSAPLYFGPTTIWIPQYNYRAGWYFHERWSISLGLDHMKYVVEEGQTVTMDGYVNGTRSILYTTQEGSREVQLTQDFLKFEHTDGLNLLSVDVEHYDPLWKARSGNTRLRAFEGVHAGPVIPRSDVRLFGAGMNNRFNVAGYGIGAQVGLRLNFLRHLFIRSTVKGGYIDLPRVLTTGNNEDHADHRFWFLQHSIVVGGRFRIGGGKSDGR